MATTARLGINNNNKGRRTGHRYIKRGYQLWLQAKLLSLAADLQGLISGPAGG